MAALEKSQVVIGTVQVDHKPVGQSGFSTDGNCTKVTNLDVGYHLDAENPRSVLIHCLHILVLTQLQQTFNPFDALWGYITSDGQQLRRLDLVPQQPIYSRQLENHIGLVWGEISQELQILNCELNVGEWLEALRNGDTSMPCTVSFQ